MIRRPNLSHASFDVVESLVGGVEGGVGTAKDLFGVREIELGVLQESEGALKSAIGRKALEATNL